MISGICVFYPDKIPTQRVGIVPDIEARPTIEGIMEGRDEVLEAALRHILGPAADEETIRRMALRPWRAVITCVIGRKTFINAPCCLRIFHTLCAIFTGDNISACCSCGGEPKRKLRETGAGHPIPLLRRRSGDVERLETCGLLFAPDDVRVDRRKQGG